MTAIKREPAPLSPLTGDHAATAQSIARAIGLQPRAQVPTGPEIATLDDAALARAVAGVDICARVLPEHKLRLVRALQAGGECVGMTGDGVKDAPKAAEQGIGLVSLSVGCWMLVSAAWDGAAVRTAAFVARDSRCRRSASQQRSRRCSRDSSCG